MKPTRSKEHLALIRSLPCCVSGKTNRVEAAHVGRRGLSQKCSDFEAIPLNYAFHREQHHMGLRAFVRKYGLDIPELLALLNAKPRVALWQGRYIGHWRNEVFVLGLVGEGLPKSLAVLKGRIHENLTELILTRVESRPKHRGPRPVY